MVEARDSRGRFVSVDGGSSKRRRRSRSRRRESSRSLSRARSIAAENRPRDRYGRFLPENGSSSRRRSRSRSRSRSRRYNGFSVKRSIEAEIRPRDARGRFLPEGKGYVKNMYRAEYGAQYPHRRRRYVEIYSPGYAVGEFRGNTQQSAQLVDADYGVASLMN